eukprot:COSAG05_NODE_2950_length_2473_cov_60.232098_7_plen_95_part_00
MHGYAMLDCLGFSMVALVLCDQDDAAVGLSRSDVSNDRLKGKSSKEVFVLYSRFLAHDRTFGNFITFVFSATPIQILPLYCAHCMVFVNLRCAV